MTDHLDPHRLVRLRGCHPELQARVKALIATLAAQGLELVLTQGVRSVAQQQALYAQGRYKPGKIVTNCDGVVKVSNHQPKADGYGYAVDVAWRTASGVITWEGPWETLGQAAEAQRLIWGGHFRVIKDGKLVSWPDLPHLELPSSFAAPSARKA
jgi:peptidoglycan L-alanyl-D-glutamate endopeptidase CwlK